MAFTGFQVDDILGGLSFVELGGLANYILGMLRESTSAQCVWDEDMFNTFTFKESVSIARVIQCVQKMVEAYFITEALHSLVLVKSLIHGTKRYLPDRERTEVHKSIDAAIDRLFRWAENAGKHGSSTGNTPCCRWCRPPRALTIDHWDFASSARSLCATYFSHECARTKYSARLNQHMTGEGAPPCFHTSSTFLLDWLQKKAWSEIRIKVLLTMGTIFPAELMERMFEFVLSAEEIPLQPGVLEKIGGTPPGQNDLFQQPQRRRTKKVYWCCDLDPDKDVE